MSERGETVGEAFERIDRGELPDDAAARRAYEAEREALQKSPPDADPATQSTGVFSIGYKALDRSTTYVAKKLEEARGQHREHEANRRAKERVLREAKCAEARVRAHVDYWREILRKDVG